MRAVLRRRSPGPAGRVANHDHMLDTRRHRHLVELRQAGIDDDHPVPGMLDDMREIAGVQANVQRVEHGPHRGHRKVRFQVLTTVPGQRRDTIAGTDAEIPERACELLRSSQHVGIPVAMDRGAVAIDNRPLAEKHGRPPDDRRHRQLVIHVRPAVPPHRPSDRVRPRAGSALAPNMIRRCMCTPCLTCQAKSSW